MNDSVIKLKIKEETLARPGQLLTTHSSNVSSLASQFGSKIGVATLLRVAGLLHDTGKASAEWQEYLRKKIRGEKVETRPHSIVGAKRSYDETASSFLHIREAFLCFDVGKIYVLGACRCGSLRCVSIPSGIRPHLSCL